MHDFLHFCSQYQIVTALLNIICCKKFKYFINLVNHAKNFSCRVQSLSFLISILNFTSSFSDVEAFKSLSPCSMAILQVFPDLINDKSGCLHKYQFVIYFFISSPKEVQSLL